MSRACDSCLRRAWLLGELSERLDHHRYDAERLSALLERDDLELIEALAGEHCESLLRRHRAFSADHHAEDPAIMTICHHDDAFPQALHGLDSAPRLLYGSRGEGGCLGYLLKAPAVAIVGSRAPTDYGIEIARSLGRGLASAGVTVIAGLADGIAASAHAGALEIDGPTLTVMPGGIDVGYPKHHRELHNRLWDAGGVISELPPGNPVRRWCHPARARIVAGLAHLVIVVEARERPGELVHTRMARASGRPVAAVPGRVNSPLSAGPHALLADGASLVTGPQDALDLLCGVGVRRVPHQTPSLDARLGRVLERVRQGEDTLGKLAAGRAIDAELLVALAELELLGALRRGDGGRYVPSGDF